MQRAKRVTFIFLLIVCCVSIFLLMKSKKNKVITENNKDNNIVINNIEPIKGENGMLIQKAREVMKNAYNPYSKFYVGAALLTKDGKIYTGCNVENVSFGATICAERVALCKAISEGDRNFVKIAITSSGNDFIYPCGMCRQMLAEFNKDLLVIVSNGAGEIKEYSLAELLPHSFDNFTPSESKIK